MATYIPTTEKKEEKKKPSLFKKIISRLKIGGVILILLLIAVASYFVFGSYSEGYRAGNVMKLSKKGLVFKTWEGELNVGGFSDGGGDGDMATTVWSFSVEDETVVKEIEKAVDEGSKVKLRYVEKYFQLDFCGDTKYFVTKVEQVDGE
ncbi:MAG: hypothetical protein ACI9XO_000674 [Paraglaciecola sp.]|jgi:hypothetical protein